MQWLFWQAGGLGPMAGQNHHFVQYAPEKIPYAIQRYVNETSRLYAVLDRRLTEELLGGGTDALGVRANLDLGDCLDRHRHADWFAAALAYPGVQLVDLSPEISIDANYLPGDFHKDPADRIIVATARVC